MWAGGMTATFDTRDSISSRSPIYLLPVWLISPDESAELISAHIVHFFNLFLDTPHSILETAVTGAYNPAKQIVFKLIRRC